MKAYRVSIFILLFSSLLWSCNKDSSEVSFYYWKTIFQLNAFEKDVLKKNKVTRIYIRYFDVALNEQGLPYPLSPIMFVDKPTSFEIIPVIYIKNNVFKSEGVKTDELARNIYKYIGKINSSNSLKHQEVQFDCDWTIETRDAFFNFIKAFKAQYSGKISATIRLHQVKYYKKTGIPPVDKGVLMYYNMGKLLPDSSNSIYEKDIVEKYIKTLKDYPLALDVALPIFSNGIQIRNKKIINLISKIDIQRMEKDTNFIRLKNGYFQVKHFTLIQGIFYKEEDIIKLETVTKTDLKEMISDLKQNIKENPKEVIFYDLDSININHIDYETKIYQNLVSGF